MSSRQAVRCLSCDKSLPFEGIESGPLISQNAAMHPLVYGGIVFRSSGQFGSRLLDPIDSADRALQIIICDQCLIQHKARVQPLVTEHTEPKAKYCTFDKMFSTESQQRIIEQLKQDDLYKE